MNGIKTTTIVITFLVITALCLTGFPGKEDAPENPLQETVYASGTPYLKITAIDYGGSSSVYGDATLLESDGKFLLIDTGDKDSNRTVIKYLKKRGAKDLSLYLSHYHPDHCYYAETILKDSWFHIRKVYLANPDPVARYATSYFKKHKRQLYNSCSQSYDYYKKIVAAANKRKIPVKKLKRGDTFSIGSASAKVLWDHNSRSVSYFDPYDEAGVGYANNSSLVTRFTMGKKRFLTGGDIEASTERDLIFSGLDLSADIFKLNHHGIWSSNTIEFLREVNPCYVYYSYKGKNKDPEHRKFGSGSDVAVTMNKLKDKYNILGTRYNGNITYTIQDNTISVSAERHIKKKTVRVRRVSTNKVGTKTLVYNDAQSLHLDKRMLPYGTKLVSGTAADPAARYIGWVKTSSGWRYRTKAGTWLAGGWKTIGSYTYYFTNQGIRKEGWLQLGSKKYFLSRTGIRQSGWQMIDGKVYYFYEGGTMAHGTTRINGVRWPLRADGSLDLSKKDAPEIHILTVEHRHTTRP